MIKVSIFYSLCIAALSLPFAEATDTDGVPPRTQKQHNRPHAHRTRLWYENNKKQIKSPYLENVKEKDQKKVCSNDQTLNVFVNEDVDLKLLNRKKYTLTKVTKTTNEAKKIEEIKKYLQSINLSDGKINTIFNIIRHRDFHEIDELPYLDNIEKGELKNELLKLKAAWHEAAKFLCDTKLFNDHKDIAMIVNDTFRAKKVGGWEDISEQHVASLKNLKTLNNIKFANLTLDLAFLGVLKDIVLYMGDTEKSAFKVKFESWINEMPDVDKKNAFIKKLKGYINKDETENNNNLDLICNSDCQQGMTNNQIRTGANVINNNIYYDRNNNVMMFKFGNYNNNFSNNQNNNSETSCNNNSQIPFDKQVNNASNSNYTQGMTSKQINAGYQWDNNNMYKYQNYTNDRGIGIEITNKDNNYIYNNNMYNDQDNANTNNNITVAKFNSNYSDLNCRPEMNYNNNKQTFFRQQLNNCNIGNDFMEDIIIDQIHTNSKEDCDYMYNAQNNYINGCGIEMELGQDNNNIINNNNMYNVQNDYINNNVIEFDNNNNNWNNEFEMNYNNPQINVVNNSNYHQTTNDQVPAQSQSGNVQMTIAQNHIDITNDVITIGPSRGDNYLSDLKTNQGFKYIFSGGIHIYTTNKFRRDNDVITIRPNSNLTGNQAPAPVKFNDIYMYVSGSKRLISINNGVITIKSSGDEHLNLLQNLITNQCFDRVSLGDIHIYTTDDYDNDDNNVVTITPTKI